MTKKKKTIGKIVIPKEKIIEAEKPRFNAYQGGTGAWKNKKKYTRKEKHQIKYY